MREVCNRRRVSRWLPLLMLAVAGAPAAAQEVAAPARALPLWEVTDGDGTVYLLGSIHMLRAETYPLDDALYAAFDEADVAVFEVDLDSAAASAGTLAVRGTFTDGRKLSDVVPADLYASLRRELQRLGMPAEAMSALKPWMAALSVSAMALHSAGYEAAQGVDMHFFERAKTAGKEILGLETLEHQIDVFDTLPEEEQVLMLRSTLDDLEGFAELLDESTELWRRGDAEGIAAQMTDQMEDQPNLRRRMLDDRNAAWVPHIEKLLRTGRTAIVIVGMAHLVDEGSVVDLLGARGWTVERRVAPQ